MCKYLQSKLFWGKSEWMSDFFNVNSAIFQLYHGENKLMMMMRFALYKTNTLSRIFIVLVHCKNKPLFLRNTACIAEKQHISIL